MPAKRLHFRHSTSFDRYSHVITKLQASLWRHRISKKRVRLACQLGYSPTITCENLQQTCTMKKISLDFIGIGGSVEEGARLMMIRAEVGNLPRVLQRHLTRVLLKKRPGVNLEDVLPHQDNAPALTPQTALLEIGLLGLQDLAPMDFRLFPVLKSALKDSYMELFLVKAITWKTASLEHLLNCVTRRCRGHSLLCNMPR